MGFRSRKGSLQDLVLIAGAIFALAVTLLVSYKLNTSIQDEFNNSTLINDTKAQDQVAVSLGVFDYGIVFIFVSLFLVIGILAYRIPTHPVFLPVSIVFTMLIVLLGVIYADAFEQIAGTSAFQSAANSIPFASQFMTNLHWLLGVTSFIIIVAMYSSRGRSEAV